MTYQDATGYLQVEPEWSNWTDKHGEKLLRGAKIVAVTQKRPTKPRAGTVIAKVTLRIPNGAFLPLRPEAVIVIPEDMTVASQPIEVEAGDAHE